MNQLFLMLLLALVGVARAHAQNADVFAHWFDDQRKETSSPGLKIFPAEGEIPIYLHEGRLVRLGPTVLRTEKRNYTNFIDGFGRITQWQFTTDGGVEFMSSIIKSKLWNASDSGRDIPAHITQEKLDPVNRALLSLDYMDNTDVTVYKFRESSELLTFTDFSVGNRIDPVTLGTLGNMEYNDDAKGTYASSHAAEYYDKAVNDIVLVNYLGQPTAGGIQLQVYKMGSDLKRHVVGSVNVKFTPYSIHQISVTGDYAIVVLGPVEIDFLGTGVSKCLSCETHDKLPKDPTMIYVFSLLSSDPEKTPVTIPIPPPDNFFVFHHINAILHDDGHNVDMDMCVYLSMDNIATTHVLGNLKDMYSPATRDGLTANCDAIRRVSFDISAKKVTNFQDFSITDAYSNSYRLELASLNPNLLGKPYCYIYAPTNHMFGSSRYEDMGILKVDLCAAQRINAHLTIQGTPTVVASWSQIGVYLGEPLFVPNPQSTTEDDGVVLVLGRNGTSESVLLILDAKDLTLQSKILAPFPLMFETHGRFIV